MEDRIHPFALNDFSYSLPYWDQCPPHSLPRKPSSHKKLYSPPSRSATKTAVLEPIEFNEKRRPASYYHHRSPSLDYQPAHNPHPRQSRSRQPVVSRQPSNHQHRRNPQIPSASSDLLRQQELTLYKIQRKPVRNPLSPSTPPPVNSSIPLPSTAYAPAEPGWKLHQYDHIKLRSPLSPAPSYTFDSNSSSTTSTSDSRSSKGIRHHPMTTSTVSSDWPPMPPPSSSHVNRMTLKHPAAFRDAAACPSGSVKDDTTSQPSSSCLSSSLPHSHDLPTIPRPRRYSQGDALGADPPVLLEKRASTPKLRRVLSAKPCVKPVALPADDLKSRGTLFSTYEPDNMDTPPCTHDDADAHTDSPAKLKPSFWNPRTETDIMPVKRTISRRLRGLLLPQKSKLDGAIKDQHLVHQQWSVARPMTPLDDIDFYNIALLDELDNGTINNPFYMISRSWTVGGAISLDVEHEDFTQIDTYASNVQQQGQALTPKLLTLKSLIRPYRRELDRLRAVFTWIMLNISIIDQRNPEERRLAEEIDQLEQQIRMSSSTTFGVPLGSNPNNSTSNNYRPLSKRRWSTSKRQTQQPPDECELELPLMDVMTGQGVLPQGDGSAEVFEDWLHSESAQQVFHRRKCSSSIGMANLFCEMALAAGMEEARVVFGYLRAPKDTIENARSNSTTTEDDDDTMLVVQSHAWCCVKIEGEYRFVDCWLAFPSQPQNKYQIEEHWFLTKPPDMIYTHFPCEPHDQCLEPAISLETFFALPYVWPTFFAHRLKMIRYNPDTLIVTDDQMCHLTIRVDPNTICIAMVETEDGQVMRALAQCRFAQTIDGHPEKVYKIKAVLPKNAPHGWLKLFVAPLEWLDTHMFYRPDMPSNDINSMVDNYSGNGGHMSSSTAMTLTLQVPDLAAVFPLTQHVSGHVRSALPEHPFGFVHLHPCQYEFNVQEPQCYYLYPLQTYNFFIRGGESHHKLAIRSPGGKLFKLMYYPQDHLYDGSVTLSEVGKWTLICLTHNSTGWLVVATWMCTHPLSS